MHECSIVEALLKDTLVSGQLYFTKPHFNSHKNYVFLYSCKRQ